MIKIAKILMATAIGIVLLIIVIIVVWSIFAFVTNRQNQFGAKLGMKPVVYMLPDENAGFAQKCALMASALPHERLSWRTIPSKNNYIGRDANVEIKHWDQTYTPFGYLGAAFVFHGIEHFRAFSESELFYRTASRIATSQGERPIALVYEPMRQLYSERPIRKPSEFHGLYWSESGIADNAAAAFGARDADLPVAGTDISDMITQGDLPVFTPGGKTPQEQRNDFDNVTGTTFSYVDLVYMNEPMLLFSVTEPFWQSLSSEQRIELGATLIAAANQCSSENYELEQGALRFLHERARSGGAKLVVPDYAVLWRAAPKPTDLTVFPKSEQSIIDGLNESKDVPGAVIWSDADWSEFRKLAPR